MNVPSRIIIRGVEGSILETFKIGIKEVPLSHLQFADDTMLFCYGNEESFLVLNHILGFFEAMLELKINRSKSLILELTCDLEKLNRWVGLADYEIGSFPSSYLGLPLRGNPRALSFWNGPVEKVRKSVSLMEEKFFF